MKKTVAAVIPVYRPGETLKELLRRLSLQTHVPEHLILLETADQGSGDIDLAADEEEDEEDIKTLQRFMDEKVRKRFQKISYRRVEKKEFRHGKVRDMGISLAKTDLVLCMTQDAEPADRYLVGRLEQAFEDPETGAAYARQLAGKGSSILEKESRRFNYPAESAVRSAGDIGRLGIRTFFCSDVCAMWSRQIYQELGGFDRETIFNEDMIMAAGMIDAGYKVAYRADARVWHSHHYSGLRQLHRNFDLGVSQADHPEVFKRVSSGNEGIRFVRAVTGDLIKSGRALLIPEFVWQSGMKYIGFRLGRMYRSLPEPVIMKLTDSPDYWKSRKD